MRHSTFRFFGILSSVLIHAAILGPAFAEEEFISFAPQLTGLPDVIICDDELSGDIDNNWFRSFSVFDLRDYVTDLDSDINTDLIYVFVEENSHDSIAINDRTQVDNRDRYNPAAWGGNEITGLGGTRNFELSFTDLLRSHPSARRPAPPYFPNPTDAEGTEIRGDTPVLLPWQTDDADPSVLGGQDRWVAIYVADEFDNISSDTLRVYSMNAGRDAIWPAAYVIFGPVVGPTGGPFDFGSQDIRRGASVSQTVVLRNTGTNGLRFMGPEIALGTGDASDFRVVSDTGEGILNTGETRTLEVAFDPESRGAKNSTLTIWTNSAETPQTDITLLGAGVDLSAARRVWHLYE